MSSIESALAAGSAVGIRLAGCTVFRAVAPVKDCKVGYQELSCQVSCTVVGLQDQSYCRVRKLRLKVDSNLLIVAKTIP